MRGILRTCCAMRGTECGRKLPVRGSLRGIERNAPLWSRGEYHPVSSYCAAIVLVTQ